MSKRLEITLTNEDVKAALAAYVSQKYGTLRDIKVQLNTEMDYVTDTMKLQCAFVSGYVGQEEPPAS